MLTNGERQIFLHVSASESDNIIIIIIIIACKIIVLLEYYLQFKQM